MTTQSNTIFSDSTIERLSLWINRGLELLWLLAVILIPLAFLGRTENDPLYGLSEAVISYVEVPKIALLRTLAGLIAVLWLVEWGLRGRLPIGPIIRGETAWLRPSSWPSALVDWLKGQPTRWVVLSVWFFLAVTLLSTVFSAQVSVSLWGEIPGQDGYATYTVLAYLTIFGAIEFVS